MTTTVYRFTDEDFARQRAEDAAKIAEHTKRGNEWLAERVRAALLGEGVPEHPARTLFTDGWHF